MTSVIDWAFEQDIGDPLSKLVFLVVAHNCNVTGACLLSIREIADQCNCSKNTARRHLHDLQEQGLIHLEEIIGYPNIISLVGSPYHDSLISGGAANVCTN